jgi:hypothetical protein
MSISVKPSSTYMNSLDAIKMQTNVLDHQNTMIVCNDLVTYVKAFNGDVYGSFVRDWKVLGEILKTLTIQARLDPSYISVFLNLLSFKYRVMITKSEDFLNNNIVVTCLKISPLNTNTFNFLQVTMEIVYIPKSRFHLQRCDFDVNLLSENSTSMYIYKYDIPGTIHICDKIGYVKERICKHVFCLLNKTSMVLENPLSVNKLVESAHKMISNGWIMDDHLLSDDSWILSTWVNLMLQKSRKRRILQNGCECSLCQEDFEDNDIVLNTCCNHTFHWKCRNNQGGIKKWVEEHENISCPICRSNMF